MPYVKEDTFFIKKNLITMLFDIYKMTCKASSNKYSHNWDKNLKISNYISSCTKFVLEAYFSKVEHDNCIINYFFNDVC